MHVTTQERTVVRRNKIRLLLTSVIVERRFVANISFLLGTYVRLGKERGDNNEKLCDDANSLALLDHVALLTLPYMKRELW